MATFPTLSVPPSNNYSDEIVKPIVRTKFEGNYNQTRPKYTRSAKNFNLKFRPITEADKLILETFFDTNSGNSFTWTNPSNEVVYTVRFVEESLKFKRILAIDYEVSIPLEEV